VDYHLDRKIRLSEESGSWSLQELTEEGKQIGRDQILWHSSSYFTASELFLNYSIDIRRENKTEEAFPQAQERETIYAILHPGICRRNGSAFEDDISYSMFGTNRRIKEFGLKISKAENGNDEKCHMWGCVGFSVEVDFVNEIVDDTVEIYLSLSPKKFNKIVRQIKFQQVDILRVHLSMVSGFYSEWSPESSTSNIKILTEDQEVLISEGCKIDPPKLGDVGEFTITVIQRCKLNPKQDLRAIDIDTVFEGP